MLPTGWNRSATQVFQTAGSGLGRLSSRERVTPSLCVPESTEETDTAH